MKSWLSSALLTGLAVCAYAQEVTPGQWEDKTSYTVNGKPLAIPDEHGRQVSVHTSTGCLASKDAGDVRATMERNMARDMPGCRLTQWNYVAGTLKVKVNCDAGAQGGTGTLEGSGPLSANRYDISGTGRSQHPQFGPMTIGFRYQGRYVGACKS
ncbi:DUF3617 domain-containing protein [Ralstonia insidiosa]|uniref:DUF3617 domain-containing protein n=1 Tax=Ralstonia insidiosa TaxID=190721 RepID=A0A848PF55_9RALS|nr:DUF3617 family protein [Ralstonia insidiosa]NMV42138.1 DUF3617 domain-containing protein [Ralstonia insidiosa]